MIPPKTLLAAVDFSDASRAALAAAAGLAAQTGAALHVLHAPDPLLADATRAAGLDLAAETREELQAFVRGALPGTRLQPQLHVVTGPPVRVLCEIAQRECADLIVLGMHGMSGAERRMFGSTTEGVLRAADVSILVVPAEWALPDAAGLRGLGPMVAAVDLTTPGLAALRAACRLAVLAGTTVEAVHVVPALPVPARWSGQADAVMRERVDRARRDIETVVRGLAPDVSLELRVETGPIAERLADAVAARSGQHPLLVMGRRSHADRGGAPGDTAYRLLTMSDVPVLVYLAEA